MSPNDIVERLQNDPYNPDVRVWHNRGRHALIEIERLQTTNIRLQDERLRHLYTAAHEVEIERLRAIVDADGIEKDRLAAGWRSEKAEIERLEELIADRFEVKMKMAERIKELEAEIERLRAALRPFKDRWRKLDDENAQMQADIKRLRADREAVLHEIGRLQVGITDALGLLSDGPGGPRRISAMKLLRELLTIEFEYPSLIHGPLCGEAAAEIERLQNHAQELEAELRKSAYSEGELQAEIERLRADKEAISQTASDYLHEIERLRAENLVLSVMGTAANESR